MSQGKTIKEFWDTCDIVPYLMMLARDEKICSQRTFVLVNAMIANDVRNFMTHEKFTKLLDAAFKFANGEMTRDELLIYESNATGTNHQFSQANLAIEWPTHNVIAAVHVQKLLGELGMECPMDYAQLVREMIKKPEFPQIT